MSYTAEDITETEAYTDYVELVGSEYANTDDFEEAYEGQYDSMEAFAWDFAEEVGINTEAPPGFKLTVDLSAWESDFMISDNGHVFRNL